MSACHIDDRNFHVAGRETECRSSQDVTSANDASAWYLSIGRTRLTMRVPWYLSIGRTRLTMRVPGISL